MNWMPEIFRLAALHDGQLDHPEVVKWAHEQWRNGGREWRYEVDGQHRFSTQREVIEFLHISHDRFTKKMTGGTSELIIKGHVIRLNESFVKEHEL